MAALAAVCFLAGVFIGGASHRRALREALERQQALKRDFETVSAVNARLLMRDGPQSKTVFDDEAFERFMLLYDDAKRRLHRALDRHNATAPRPIVIARDGANLVQVVEEVPRGGFSEDIDQDAGIRLWMRHVFEADALRRTARQAPDHVNVIALETERASFEALVEHGPTVTRRRA